MKSTKAIKILFACLVITIAMNAFAQITVEDPLALLSMVKKWGEEAKQWAEKIKHWKSLGENWKAELEHFTFMKDQLSKQDTWLNKLYNEATTNNAIFSHFVGPVGSDFNFDDLRLKEIRDFMDSNMLGGGSTNDAYSGLFTDSGSLETSFPGIRDWSFLQSSDRFKTNQAYQKYISQVIEDQNKCIADIGNKIKLMGQLNKMVPEREKKFQEIQKRLEEYAKEPTMNLPKMWVLSAEIELELSRQMFHIVTLQRIEAENQMLDELRGMNQKKKDQSYEASTDNTDVSTAQQLMTGK